MVSIAFRLFLAVLIFAPLAFGTQEPWSLMVMEAGMLIGLAFILFRPPGEGDELYRVPGLLPLALLLAFIALQLLPLPAQIVRIIAPSIHAVYVDTVAVLDPDAWLTLSVNRKATMMQFWRFVAYGACYILTVQLLTDRSRLRRAVWVIIGLATGVAVLAILQKFLSPDKIYGFRTLPRLAWPIGPFVYHNHFAGFMEMLVPPTLALFFHYRPPIHYKKSWKRRLYDIFGHYRAHLHILLGLAFLLMVTSIFVSLSRGGIISVSIASLVLLVMLRRRRQEGGFFILPVCGLLLVLAVGWFGWEAVFARFVEMRNAQGELSNSRFYIWRDTFEIIRRFPWAGTGFGTFGDIYPSVRTYPGSLVVDHAHNDYLELLANGGIVSFGLTAWFVAATLTPSIRRYRQRKEPFSIALFLGAVCGMLALLLHGVTDFNFYNGANGLFFFFLAGLAVASAHTRMRDGLANRLPKMQVRGRRLFGMATAVLVVAMLWFHLGILTAAHHFAGIDEIFLGRSTSRDELQRVRKIARTAALQDQLEARYHFALANVNNLLGNTAAARHAFGEAIRLNPVNAEYLQGTALFMAGQGEVGRAEALMQTGIEFDPTNADRHGRYGAWLLGMGRREAGLDSLGRAIKLAPRHTNIYISLMLLHGLSDQEMLRAMPEDGRACLIFADYLQEVGRKDLVDVVYRNILEFLERKDDPGTGIFYKIYNYYLRQGRQEEALAVMAKAGELLPDNAGIRLTMGQLYEKMDIPYRAIEEYEKALVIDPANRRARKRLDQLKGEK